MPNARQCRRVRNLRGGVELNRARSRSCLGAATSGLCIAVQPPFGPDMPMNMCAPQGLLFSLHVVLWGIRRSSVPPPISPSRHSREHRVIPYLIAAEGSQ